MATTASSSVARVVSFDSEEDVSSIDRPTSPSEPRFTGEWPSDASSSREGWLKKKGTWSSWKDVYVVVKGGLLLEYKKEGVRSLALPTNQPTAAARYTRGHSVFLTYWRR